MVELSRRCDVGLRVVKVFLVLSFVLSSLPVFAENPYLTEVEVPLADLLAPAPAVGSEVQKADLQAVLAAQAARTPASSKRAEDDSTRSVFRFWDALGTKVDPAALPLFKALFKEIAKETEDLTDKAKYVYKRNRPFVDDPDVHPILVTPADGSRPTGQTPSYPSGHSAFATATAILLSEMVPEKRTAIFDRAAEFAHNRLVAAVHYPTDIEAGRISGTVIANALLHDARFMKDFEKAKAELRKALGLE